MGSALMDDSEAYSLSWNDFEASVATSLSDLRELKELFDVTLVCEGKHFQAHRLVLSSCSGVLRKIIKSSRNGRDPMILLWGVMAQDLESLLNFMYQGKVQVHHDRLKSFMAAAERLKIKGLTDYGKDEISTTNNSPAKPTPPPAATPPAAQPKNMSGRNSFGNKSTNNAGSRSVTPNKPVSRLPMTSTNNSYQQQNNKPMTLTAIKRQYLSEYGNNSAENSAVKSPKIEEDQIRDEFANDDDDSNQGGRNSSIGTPGSTNDQILPNGESIIAVQAQCGVEYKCAYCGKQYVSRGRTRRHITDCHETSTVPCPNCGKVFTSTRRLKDHQRSRYCHGVSHQLPQIQSQISDSTASALLNDANNSSSASPVQGPSAPEAEEDQSIQATVKSEKEDDENGGETN